MHIGIFNDIRLRISFFNRSVLGDIHEMHNYLVLKLIFRIYNLTNNNIKKIKLSNIYSANNHPRYFYD